MSYSIIKDIEIVRLLPGVRDVEAPSKPNLFEAILLS